MEKINKIIGKEPHQYKIESKLGQGAFGNVYKAVNLSTKQTVAIKHIYKKSNKITALVNSEIQIMKDLKHKNIVQYYTDFKFQGEWYIILEYCGKGDLQNYKKTVGKIPEYHCKLFIKCILEGLNYLHSKNYAHRDLKLPNILITDDYQLKLADFGFSKNNGNLFKSMCGSPLCMAPQILRRQQYSLKCDVWSLGVITYLMLFNNFPYVPSKQSGVHIVDVMANVIKNSNLQFNSKVKVSDSAIDFVSRCLQNDEKKRFSTQQLKQHFWLHEGLQFGNTSSLRIKAISGSLSQNDKSEQRFCQLMLFGVFQNQIRKIAGIMMLTTQKILKTLKDLQDYYSQNILIRQLLLLMSSKKLQQFYGESVKLIFQDFCVYNISLVKLNIFNQYVTEISSLIKEQIKQIGYKIQPDINIQKQIIKFTYQQTLKLLQPSNDDNNQQAKINLMKALCRLVTVYCPNTVINIKWGNNPEQDNIADKVASYLSLIKTDDIIKGINQQLTNEDDLQTAWLIEHQIPKQIREPIQGIQFVATVTEILNIPSNFNSQKKVNQLSELQNDD